MTNIAPKKRSTIWSSTEVFVVLVVLFSLLYLLSRPAPKTWEPAIAEFNLIATLTPSDSTQVVGTVLPWKSVPTIGRHIVLCELIDKTPIPYDCRVTAYHAVTNSGSRFKIENVQPGKYLILYDSGLADFEQSYQKWQDKVLRIGDWEWAFDNLFSDEPDGSFGICTGSPNAFYHSHPALTLAATGSPFGLAHDVETAAAYRGNSHDLALGVFLPVTVDVVVGQTSNIQFRILYCTPKDKVPNQPPPTG
jgi:hypothetical protein